MLYCLGVSESALYLDEAVLDILNIKKENSIIKQATEREFIKENTTYKTINCSINDFRIDDFAMPELALSSQIHKNKGSHKRYFKKLWKKYIQIEKYML